MTRVMKRQLEEELDLNETLSIKSPPPPAREPSTQPEKVASESPLPESPEPEYTLPRDDDDYSPAHDADEAGTGVGEETVDDVEDLAITEADPIEGADAMSNAPADGDKKAVKKKSSA